MPGQSAGTSILEIQGDWRICR